jgi:hypothetical protein
MTAAKKGARMTDEREPTAWVGCDRCGGSGFSSDCIDDLCNGREECIHGDDATCRACQGEGEVPCFDEEKR